MCLKHVKRINLYTRFKFEYKIPINYLEDLQHCKYLNYYYSEDEKINYINEWKKKSCDFFEGYTFAQFQLYENISIENCHINYIQKDHYLDEGCLCKACGLKRKELANKIIKGIAFQTRIVHTVAKKEFLKKRETQLYNINKVLQNFQKQNSNLKSNVYNNFNSNLNTLIK